MHYFKEMLKLIAPFRAAFDLNNSLIAANPTGFTTCLERLHKDLNTPDSALRKQLHPSLDIEVNIQDFDTGCRYSALNAHGSQYYLPNIFILRFKDEESAAIENIYNHAAKAADEIVKPYSKFFSLDLNALRIDLHDNTIAILSMDLEIDQAHLGKFDQVWERLDEWTTNFAYQLIYHLYKIYVLPFLSALNLLSETPDYPFIRDVTHFGIFSDLFGKKKVLDASLEPRFMLLWVNRTLCYNKEFAMNNWIRPLLRTDDEVIKVKDAEVHLNSGNSVVIYPNDMDKKHLGALWQVVLVAQYYYAAMDVVNINLVRYIGTTFTHKSSKTLRLLTAEMEDIINSVTILQVRYNDLSMEMQGVSRQIFQLVQKEWGFSNLIHSVQKKLDLCKANITVLNQETNVRNQARTEIVLTSLTGMGILNLCVELGSYATQMPDDKRKMIGNIPGFMDLGFIMSGNALSWIGLAVAVSVIIYTVKNRRS